MRRAIVTAKPWLRLTLTVLVIGSGLLYIRNEIDYVQVRNAMAVADPGMLLVALLTILLTTVAKAWRWQMLYRSQPDVPPLSPLFWALMVGQFINLVVPFLRLGEIARVYALDHRFPIGKIRSLGTLVVEKTLDLIILVLTVAVLLPFVVVPEEVVARSVTMGIVSAAVIVLLYLLAFRTPAVSRFMQRLTPLAPGRFREPFIRLVTTGLDGISVLRDPKATPALVGVTALIGVLSVATPWALFPAFGLQFGLLEAAIVHITTAIASAPATVPAKLGIFELTVFFTLRQLGVADESVVIGYAVMFHLIIMIPQLLFGSWASSQSYIHWHRSQPQQSTV